MMINCGFGREYRIIVAHQFDPEECWQSKLGMIVGGVSNIKITLTLDINFECAYGTRNII
jgi:hypothetical protein